MEAYGRHGPGSIGGRAEDRALTHLEQAGLTLLERNFRCRSGEIDLIMRDGATLVFVEVRMRRQSRFGTAAESIDTRKLRKIRSAADFWLRCAWNGTSKTRIDVVTLDGSDSRTARIAWLRGVDDTGAGW